MEVGVVVGVVVEVEITGREVGMPRREVTKTKAKKGKTRRNPTTEKALKSAFQKTKKYGSAPTMQDGSFLFFMNF